MKRLEKIELGDKVVLTRNCGRKSHESNFEPGDYAFIRKIDIMRSLCFLKNDVSKGWVSLDAFELSDPVYEIGKEYEFCDNENFKNCLELLAILPKRYKFRYIADVGNSYFRAFRFISEIQPAEPKQEMKQTEEERKKEIKNEFLELLISLSEGVTEGLKSEIK